MTTRSSEPSDFAEAKVYGEAGSFAPGLFANARAFGYVALLGDRYDVLHFVFAPNPRSSRMIRSLVRALRFRGFKGTVVQSVASQPRDFSRADELLFGDRIVALSEWTTARLGEYLPTDRRGDLRTVPPCVVAPNVSPARVEAVRRAFDLGAGPVIVYPGDYEVSSGAATFAAAIEQVSDALPHHRFVFACRTKTEASRTKQEELAARLPARLTERVRFLGNVDDMHALVQAAEQIAFPVDDLYGKVDLPLVLLEALALGRPVVVCDGGPLVEIDGTLVIPPRDPAALATTLRELGTNEARRREVGEAGREAYARRFQPAAVARAYEDIYLAGG